MTLSLIFPMAGEGARFGYRFKPFLALNGQTFIEAAFAPFRPHMAEIARVYFVFLRAQEEAHGVSRRLAAMFEGIDHRAVILERPTDGPAQTLLQCLVGEAIAGPIIVCDCDHALEVGGLMRLAATDPATACALPTWDLAGEPLSAWSVAAIDAEDRVTAIAEKRRPESGAAFRGVIGCYYFADAARVGAIVARDRAIYLSDIVRALIEAGEPVRSAPVTRATFFGDPARLETALRPPAAGP